MKLSEICRGFLIIINMYMISILKSWLDEFNYFGKSYWYLNVIFYCYVVISLEFDGINAKKEHILLDEK